MVGEYSSLGETIPRTLSTVLKYLAWHFTSEALETKLQILNSIVKVCMRTFLQCYFNLIDYFYILVEKILCSALSLFSIKQATKAINIHYFKSVRCVKLGCSTLPNSCPFMSPFIFVHYNQFNQYSIVLKCIFGHAIKIIYWSVSFIMTVLIQIS